LASWPGSTKNTFRIPTPVPELLGRLCFKISFAFAALGKWLAGI
jgi:hypothetical protein